jgi:hypothetical protein
MTFTLTAPEAHSCTPSLVLTDLCQNLAQAARFLPTCCLGTKPGKDGWLVSLLERLEGMKQPYSVTIDNLYGEDISAQPLDVIREKMSTLCVNVAVKRNQDFDLWSLLPVRIKQEAKKRTTHYTFTVETRNQQLGFNEKDGLSLSMYGG